MWWPIVLRVFVEWGGAGVEGRSLEEPFDGVLRAGGGAEWGHDPFAREEGSGEAGKSKAPAGGWEVEESVGEATHVVGVAAVEVVRGDVELCDLLRR